MKIPYWLKTKRCFAGDESYNRQKTRTAESVDRQNVFNNEYNLF